MKTLQLIEKYKTLLEQDEDLGLADATDVTEQPEAPTPLTAEGEKYLIGLVVKAFLHTADDSEAKIARELQATMLEDNPKDVVETIENFLEISSNDMRAELDKITSVGV